MLLLKPSQHNDGKTPRMKRGFTLRNTSLSEGHEIQTKREVRQSWGGGGLLREGEKEEESSSSSTATTKHYGHPKSIHCRASQCFCRPWGKPWLALEGSKTERVKQCLAEPVQD